MSIKLSGIVALFSKALLPIIVTTKFPNVARACSENFSLDDDEESRLKRMSITRFEINAPKLSITVERLCRVPRHASLELWEAVFD